MLEAPVGDSSLRLTPPRADSTIALELSKADQHSEKPLDGLRVLDFTRVLSGPYCTLLLSDLGADVIKVERIDGGDETRAWGPPFLDAKAGIATYFAALNRGKRSLAVDLNQQRGRELVATLATRCDVVVENFRPGVAQSLSIDHGTLAARNPAIVSCSINGFGSRGPFAEMAATEIVVEALSGLMEITGTVDGPPVRFGVAMVDIATGLTASTKILAALMRARSSGTGTHLEVPLYSVAIAALGTSIAAFTATGVEPKRWGSHHPSICPYGGFPTNNGFLITGVISDDAWPQFCEALQLPELATDPELVTNAQRVARRQRLEARIGAQTELQSTEYWLERLHQRRLLGAPVRGVGQAVGDELIESMGLLHPLERYPQVMVPGLDGTTVAAWVPQLGEHSAQILRELLGLGPAEIAGLTAAGVVASAAETIGV
jgi:crotonobetainyl-CoA:carnitine CoA-transferase CaiB-like acyl-CoA transferase